MPTLRTVSPSDPEASASSPSAAADTTRDLAATFGPRCDDVRARLAEAAADQGWTHAEIARGCGYSEAAVGQFLGASYAPSSKFLDAIDAFLERSAATGFRFVDTTAANEVIDACELARKRRQLVLVVGDPGLGKTVALTEYVKRERKARRTPLVVVANAAMAMSDLVQELARASDLELGGSTHGVLVRVIERRSSAPPAW